VLHHAAASGMTIIRMAISKTRDNQLSLPLNRILFNREILCSCHQLIEQGQLFENILVLSVKASTNIMRIRSTLSMFKMKPSLEK